MSCYDLEKTLETFPSELDVLVREPVCEDLSWKRRDVDSCALAFENVSESLKVGAAGAQVHVHKCERRELVAGRMEG